MAAHVMEGSQQALVELVTRHRGLYESPAIESRLRAIIRDVPKSKLSDWDVHRILRTARAVSFDTHVEVVSGHHTATYLRFASIARVPQLVRLIARDMADWVRQTYLRDHGHPREQLTGLVVTASEARLLAEGVAEVLRDTTDLRVVLTSFDQATGKIGTEIATGTIRPGERFVVLNDVTTRGNCVSKLGRVVTDHGGELAGMAVFARRDSGQFPLMDELMQKYRFYFTADLDMPQWAPEECPLCRAKKPLLSWKEMPEI
jgi:orotate phosphoribosyltransferase